jgi:YHS domain-containing protein
MTALGRQRSRLAAVWCLAAAAVQGAIPAGAATTERIVADWHSGVAIGGFDPVAYFTDAGPRQGRPDHEYALGGVTWRFRNEGNRAAFAANPEIYAPQFGGYDPAGIARGVAVAGHPELFLIQGKRLYLFYTDESRDAFAANPEAVRLSAEEKWPDVLKTLAP